jgi:carbon-monoxide dehydrogenase large subunit
VVPDGARRLHRTQPAGRHGAGLKEGAFYDPSNFTFPAGCYICEVEVDPETGKTEIIQFVAADDFGKIINPMIVEGQVHGGMAQGIGQALLEGTPTTRKPVSC